MTARFKIGIDLGGTKISGVMLDTDGTTLKQTRVGTQRGDLHASVRQICEIVQEMEGDENQSASIGIGIPGSISPHSGLVQNANSTWLNGKPLKEEVEEALGRTVRIANDANCFAMSEAVDGAGAEYKSVFGVILGTGCGGGFVFNRTIVDGPRGIGGEWGHNPLPCPSAEELPGPRCWCGRRGCIETWVSGPALSADHERRCGERLTAATIGQKAAEGCETCAVTLDLHASRLARGLAGIINILDPDCIVLGGGLSNMGHLYDVLPELVAPHVFADDQRVTILPPKHNDDSGVRGAAWLWNEPGSKDA